MHLYLQVPNAFIILLAKGPVNIYGNTGLGNERWPVVKFTVALLILPDKIMYGPGSTLSKTTSSPGTSFHLKDRPRTMNKCYKCHHMNIEGLLGSRLRLSSGAEYKQWLPFPVVWRRIEFSVSLMKSCIHIELPT